MEFYFGFWVLLVAISVLAGGLFLGCILGERRFEPLCSQDASGFLSVRGFNYK